MLIKFFLQVCLSGSECDARGGLILGSCAQGFGACCAIYVDTCTSDNFQFNLTYITNPGYPAATTAAETCKEGSLSVLSVTMHLAASSGTLFLFEESQHN